MVFLTSEALLFIDAVALCAVSEKSHKRIFSTLHVQYRKEAIRR